MLRVYVPVSGQHQRSLKSERINSPSSSFESYSEDVDVYHQETRAVRSVSRARSILPSPNNQWILLTAHVVRLGKSGLKVSRIVLGCATYGDPGWQGWVLDQKACTEHVKFAYDQGIQTFDTANVSDLLLLESLFRRTNTIRMYECSP